MANKVGVRKCPTHDEYADALNDPCPSWIDKHSVNCYFCGKLVDERDCEPADPYNNNDGGDICPECQKEVRPTK